MDDDAPQPLRRHCTQHQTFPTRAEYCYHQSDANTITAGIDCYDQDSTFGDLTFGPLAEKARNVNLYTQARPEPTEGCRDLSGFSEMTRALPASRAARAISRG